MPCFEIMSNAVVSTTNRRSKRRAAVVAAQKIKKIVDDDVQLERESQMLHEDSNRNQKMRKKKRITTKPSVESLFFENNEDDHSPSLSISISNGSLSLPSLSSIPERISFSNSTNVGSIMSSPSLNDDRPIPDGSYFSDSLNIGSTNSFSYEEFQEAVERYGRPVNTNSTGTMYLSKSSAYRVSLFSPQKSPARALKLNFSPFASFPTTPMHVYQYRSRVSIGPQGTIGRLNRSAKARRRVRSSCGGKGGVIEPRQLVS